MGYQGKLLWLDGKPMIQSKDKLVEWLQKYPEGIWFTFNVDPIGDINVTDQQKLYFTWRDILADYFGYTKAEMHDELKRQFNDGQSTKGLDTKGWSLMMTQVLAFAGEHNVTLPTGNSE